MYNVDSKGDLYAVTDPTELKALNAGAKYALPFAEVGLVTSDFIEDASYLRLAESLRRLHLSKEMDETSRNQ